MILIFSRDPATVRDLSRNQGNVPVATFGARQRLDLWMPQLGVGENLFIVADMAKRNQAWVPVLGDSATGLFFEAHAALSVIRTIFPDQYAGTVYVAARQVEAQLSCLHFANRFYTQGDRAGLLEQRMTLNTIGYRGQSRVFAEAGPARGPIVPPLDTRWTAARVLASEPVITTPTVGNPINPLVPTLY